MLDKKQLNRTVKNRPANFGEEPMKYRSDVIFLIDIDVEDAVKVFNPKPGVDTIWQCSEVMYSERLIAEATQSNLGKIMVPQHTNL